MNPKVKKMWIDRLRSGTVEQTKRGAMWYGDERCCLGVLGDLYCETHPGTKREDTTIGRRARTAIFSPEVLFWAGLDQKDCTPLAAHNDTHEDRGRFDYSVGKEYTTDFEGIAQIIEENY